MLSTPTELGGWLALVCDMAPFVRSARGGFLLAGRLPRDFQVLLIDDLVKQGSALWFDRGQRSALILWRGIPEWAELIYRWARGCGFEDSVVTVDEMQVGQGGCRAWQPGSGSLTGSQAPEV